MNELLWPLSMQTQLWEARDALTLTLMNESSPFVASSQPLLLVSFLTMMLVIFRLRKSRENYNPAYCPNEAPNDFSWES